ncbi:hypothetical protein CE143_08640 [Photorhabdus luminescens]|uniref:Baseplate protein J-like domain-containing protein n=1 Tax=Photorhabdus akhurstii TaxID=171438 RepID=A0ABX8LRN6_9GAMM|nr:hypothetical protein [Photorhabdus akhurstii]QXF33207.1 hypothetical protein B0X70_08725 [Photorhabdus akhurstii]UJD75003.1 hypothetical protein CE143_08640 [Photorhabdus luminescens]
MGQAELENKLSAIVPDTAFKLDERSTLDILNWLKTYAKEIPFDQEKKQFWDSFYFIQENNPQQLADIYQNANKTDGLLPAHQAFILAFLKLLETTNRLLNTFPARHRSLYYRELLGLKPKKAQADKVAIEITLNTDNPEFLVAKGTLFDAGQDNTGNPLQYASDTDLLANQGKLTDLRWYRKVDNVWKSAILLSDSDNIEFPKNGIQLFSEKSNDLEVQSDHLNWGEANISSLTHDTFYLGFTNVLPGQTLSLYWQSEGVKALNLSWSYLNQKNIWQPINQLVHDQTHNLSDRGIWRTLLPKDAANQAALMPTGRYWLKAEITHQTDPQDYPRIKGLLYNAATATLVNADTVEQDHFINGLAADSIKQPVNASPAISGVTQPWASWDGHPQETEQAFLTRLPARLSHRNRALSWGNIVTLLKEQFVSLFDVKYPSAGELTKIPAPEKQQLIVIPDSRYKDNDDALRPTLNPARLAEMVEWIKQLSSPWATIEINNPTYIDVNVNYQVTFIAGVNPDYGYHQLQQQLSRKYMPWGENATIGVTVGNRIDYYQLLATIQQSPLVERVTDLSLTIANRVAIEAADNEVLILVWSEQRPSNQGANQ